MPQLQRSRRIELAHKHRAGAMSRSQDALVLADLRYKTVTSAIDIERKRVPSNDPAGGEKSPAPGFTA